MESAKPVKVLMMNCDKLVNLDEIKAHLFPSTHDQYFPVKIEYFDIDDIDSKSKEMSERSKDEQYDVGIFAVHANESRLSINKTKGDTGYTKIYNALREMTGDKVVVIIAYDSNYKDPTQTTSSLARSKISSQFSGEYLDGPKGFVLSWKKHPERCHKDVVHQFITSVRQDIKESIIDMYKENTTDSGTGDDIDSESKQDGSNSRGNTVGACGETKHVKQWKTETCQGENRTTNIIDEIKEMLTLTVLIVCDRNITNIDELSLFEMKYSGLEIIRKEFGSLDEGFQLHPGQFDGAVIIVDANNLPEWNSLNSKYIELSKCTDNQVILAFANDNFNEAEDTLPVSEEVKRMVKRRLNLDDSWIDGTVSYVLSWKTNPKSPHKRAIHRQLNQKVIEKRNKIYDGKTEQSVFKGLKDFGRMYKHVITTPTPEFQVKKAVEDFLKWTKHQGGELVAVISCKDGKSDRSLEKILMDSGITEFTPCANLPSWIETTQEFNRCRESASVVCGVFRKKDGNYKLLNYNLEKR